MNKKMVESARDALALIRAIHWDDRSVEAIIIAMSEQERADIVVNLACFATIWAEMLMRHTEGDMEAFIDTYVAQLQ
jgi:hypothetical protein